MQHNLPPQSALALVLVSFIAWGTLQFTGMGIPPDIQGEAASNFVAVAAVADHREAEVLALMPDRSYHDHDFITFFSTHCPTVNLLILPFVKICGLSAMTVRGFSVFFATLALILTWFVARRATDCTFTAGISVLLVISSLIWTIHAKVAYAAWFPSVCLLLAQMWLMLKGTERSAYALGFILALQYGMGWIVVEIGLVILIAAWISQQYYLGHIIRIGSTFAAGCALILCLGAWQSHTTPLQIIYGIADVTLGRLNQGEPGIMGLGLPERVTYAVKCIFWDSTTRDPHMDKCLEGAPAIPAIFTILLLAGIILAIVRRSRSDVILLIWTGTVFVFMTLVFCYSHRYLLLAIPGMAILAAQAIVSLIRRPNDKDDHAAVFCACVVAVAITLSIIQTRSRFYHDYIYAKPVSFEMDRLRGHADACAWARTAKLPITLVLGDNINFSLPTYLLHTWNDHGITLELWPFNSASTKSEILAWEKVHRSKPTLLLLSTTALHSGETILNDPRPFFAIHPDIPTSFTYRPTDSTPVVIIGVEIPQ